MFPVDDESSGSHPVHNLRSFQRTNPNLQSSMLLGHCAVGTLEIVLRCNGDKGAPDGEGRDNLLQSTAILKPLELPGVECLR